MSHGQYCAVYTMLLFCRGINRGLDVNQAHNASASELTIGRERPEGGARSDQAVA